jgi:hypothetical protein
MMNRKGQARLLIVTKEVLINVPVPFSPLEIIGEIGREVEIGKHSEKLELLLVDLGRSRGRIEPARR